MADDTDRYRHTEFDWKRFGMEWTTKQGPFMVLFCVLLFWGIPRHLEAIKSGYVEVAEQYTAEQRAARAEFITEQKITRDEFSKALEEIRRAYVSRK